MVVADLHVHTTNSDGELSIEDVPTAATAAALDAIAVTDHDRPHPGLEEPVTDRNGVTVVHGIELRVQVGETATAIDGASRGQRVDLLGYGLEPTPDLRAECDRIQRDRAERGARIVERVEDHLGVDLDVDPGPGFGRPHVARAVADHPDLDLGVQDVFDELIGDGGPCYVARQIPSFERGRELLADACRLVGLAHPLRYDDPAAALALTSTLDAVELWYPYDRPVDPTDLDDAGIDLVERAIERHGLLPTGGSDAHETTLGAAGLDATAWERVAAELRS
ncbi:PHP domain-containing protein [Salinarchaeum chitinilyticum]